MAKVWNSSLNAPTKPLKRTPIKSRKKPMIRTNSKLNQKAKKFNTRTKALEFDNKTKALIYARDRGKCIFTGSTKNLTYAHLVPRSKNGLGIVENGALITWEVHHDMDVNENQVSQKYFRDYMERLYPGFKDSDRKYNKFRKIEEAQNE